MRLWEFCFLRDTRRNLLSSMRGMADLLKQENSKMLIYETNDELISRIESIVYVLSQRMLADELRALLIETVDGALEDVEVER